MKIKEVIENIPILYINLDRAIERKNKIENILNENNLIYKRIQAIDANNLDINELQKTYTFKNISIQEIACVLSHIKTIQYALDNNYETVLIMEDDCSFEYLEYKKRTLDELIKINNDWNIIQLGIICDEKIFNNINNYNKELIKSYYYSLGAVAYIINKNGMLKIINYFLKNKILKVADEYIYELCNTYITIPYFTQYNNIFKSFIRDNNSLEFQNNSKKLWDKKIKNII